MASSKDDGISDDMEISVVADTPNVASTDTPFLPPAGTWDVGDILPKKDKKCMILGSDQEWHEDKGPSHYVLDFDRALGISGTEFYRRNEYWSGYRKELEVDECICGYIRWEESALDQEWNKYKISSEDEMKLRTFVERMSKGNVKPTNVVCFALGSLHRPNPPRKRSFEQLAVLLKLMEILGRYFAFNWLKMNANTLAEIPPNARKAMQDPDFIRRDARFFAKFGLETVMDPQGFDAINEETLVFHVGGYRYIDERAIDRPWPAMFINIWKLYDEGKILLNKSKVRKAILRWFNTMRGKPQPTTQRTDTPSKFNAREEIRIWWQDKKRIAKIRETYQVEKIPKVGTCDSMSQTQLFCRKEMMVRGSFWWLGYAAKLLWAIFMDANYD
ncbi:hypothetical protein SBOR_9598 [Sclerotinia borealis F-4128]|uniref:SRR1-like domain-containing protein n=1 Tax=Sclerotinia borealis (strain F-4128) TaxID=1432307 RepID=W9C613_SCLBF|nr:hypothetical protein SBOR_9598 [Sclerotinia borealis F-4128]